jgi:hypothetical protein
MHGVLQRLHELLEIRAASLKLTEMISLGLDSRWHGGFVSRLGRAAYLADPGDQSLPLGHSSPPTGPLRRIRAGRVAAALFVGHLADHKRTARDLLAHQFELRLGLLHRFLTCRLHCITRGASRPRRAGRERAHAARTRRRHCARKPPAFDRGSPTSVSLLRRRGHTWPEGDSLRRRGEPHGRNQRPHGRKQRPHGRKQRPHSPPRPSWLRRRASAARRDATDARPNAEARNPNPMSSGDGDFQPATHTTEITVVTGERYRVEGDFKDVERSSWMPLAARSCSSRG